LKNTDEVKFVIGTRQDYDWAKDIVLTRALAAICPVLFSWVTPLRPRQRDKSLRKVPPNQAPISRRQLVEKIMADALPVRFQLQLHKFIWPPDQKGV
jgi:7-carboxy-7-deazaguanine synthase